MRQHKFGRHGEDHDRFILMALLKEGPLSADELTEKVNSIIQQVTLFGMNLVHSLVRSLGFNPDRERSESRKARMKAKKREHRQDFDVETEVDKLLTRGLVVVTETGKLVLTEAGKEEAKRCETKLIAATLLGLYQRFVGKRTGSLALISQSVDSKNHMYVAAAVIIGAVFSISGIHYVDALIGAYIAVHILKDGAELTGEAVSALKGETPDLARYPAPLEQHWEQSKRESFRGWILYAIAEHRQRTKDELIEALNRVFKPGYLPFLNELSFDLARGIDFDREFDALMEPLLEKKLLRQDGDAFLLTREGERSVRRIVEHMRYHRNE